MIQRLDQASRWIQGILCFSLLASISIWTYFKILDDHKGFFVGGLLSGGLHALTGPDHLAALLPITLGRQYYVAALFGGIWGLGHGAAASLIALCLYTLKGSLMQSTFEKLVMPYMLQMVDFAVGATLIVIGGLGWAESHHELENIKNSQAEKNNETNSAETTSNIDGEITNSNTIKLTTSSTSGRHFHPISFAILLMSIFSNGFLLGLSWDGLPSLGPTLGATTLDQVMSFICSYTLGTMITMSCSTTAVTFTALIVGKITDNASHLPIRLSIMSSIVALLLGGLWILQGMAHAVIGVDDRQSSMQLWTNLVAIGSPFALVSVVCYTILSEFNLWSYVSAMLPWSATSSIEKEHKMIKSENELHSNV